LAWSHHWKVALEPARISSAEIGFIHAFESFDGHLDLVGFPSRTTDIDGLRASWTPARAAPPAYPFLLATAGSVGSFRVGSFRVGSFRVGSFRVGSFNAFGVEASLRGMLKPAWQWSLNHSWMAASHDIVGNVGVQLRF